MTEFLQFAVSGVLTGGVYALLASGLTLIFGVLRVVNFAQADFMMLAMFAGYVLWAGPGIDPFLAVPVVFAAFFVIGAAFHRGLVRRVMGRRENQDAQVILTLGAALILQNVMLIAFSSEPRTIDPSYLNGGIHVGGVFIDVAHLMAFGLSVVVAGGLYLFLQRTMMGRTIRGTAEDWEAAVYMGIDTDRAHRIAFGVGIGLTAVGGLAVATFQTFNPFIGLDFLIVMFAAVVLGGLGSVAGAVVGG
jgi:branched-chain amino acid transport system permease protein